MQIWSISDVGNVRSENQDSCRVLNFSRDRALMLVCDGMGGANAGSVASALAADVFSQTVQQGYKQAGTEQAVLALLREALAAANGAVYEKASTDAAFFGMGTTLVAAYFAKNTAYIINVGDSRAYHFTQDGVKKITVDHSIVEYMVQRGELTSEEAKNFPGSNLITRAVGTEPLVEGDVYVQPMAKEQTLLLCSDGLSGEMADQEMLFEVLHGGERKTCCERLLAIAKNRGAPDNVTAVLAAF